MIKYRRKTTFPTSSPQKVNFSHFLKKNPVKKSSKHPRIFSLFKNQKNDNKQVSFPKQLRRFLENPNKLISNKLKEGNGNSEIVMMC